jgi:hypothetical protein
MPYLLTALLSLLGPPLGLSTLSQWQGYSNLRFLEPSSGWIGPASLPRYAPRLQRSSLLEL